MFVLPGYNIRIFIKRGIPPNGERQTLYMNARLFKLNLITNGNNMTDRELQFMQAAIDLARHGMNNGIGGPFGCIIVKDDTIVGQGCNSVASENDPTAHAEVVAIRDACKNLQTFQLTDCEIYTSCEPCPMCMGAIYWARPKKVYFGATRHDAAAAGFDDSLIYKELIAPLHDRIIEMVNVGRENVIKVFEEWNEKPDKIEY
jgi:tRNA(Arg) A34 adenosine deaminase TadA